MRLILTATVLAAATSSLLPVRSAATPPIRSFVGEDTLTLERAGDPEMAAGPDHVVLVYNSSLIVQDKDGSILREITFQDLVSVQGVLQDPEVVYDPESGEYFVVIMQSSTPNFFLGVLGDVPDDDSDWKFYSFAIGSGGVFTIDQPNLTIQDDTVLVWSVNTSALPRTTIAVVVDKAAVVARDPAPASAIVEDELAGGTITSRSGPSLMPKGESYLLAAQLLQSTPLTAEKIRLRAMKSPETVFTTDPGNHFTQQFDLPISTVVHERDVLTTNSSTTRTWVDFRSRTEFVNDNLWLVHTIKADTNRSIVRWYQIDLNGWPVVPSMGPCVVRSGDISPPTALKKLDPTVSAFYPSIDVNKYGTAVVVFLVTGATTPVGMYASAKLPSETTFGEASEVLTSTEDIVGSFSDYTRVDIDAANPHVFWAHHTLAGSGPNRTLPGRSTWVAAFAPIFCPADLTGSSDPADPDYGDPDGIVDSEDFFYFYDKYAAGELEVDLSSTAPGVPDFQINILDSDYFLSVYGDPCDAPVSTICP